MVSRFKWRWYDWVLVFIIFLVLLFLVGGNSGLAAFVRQALHLLGGLLVWAGSALNSIGR